MLQSAPLPIPVLITLAPALFNLLAPPAVATLPAIADEVFTDIENSLKESFSIWEGSVIVNEEDDRICKGKLRKLTDED